MFGKGMGNMAGMMKKVQKMQADKKEMLAHGAKAIAYSAIELCNMLLK